jgi:hypothetical protein
VQETHARTLLDYGSGKGRLYSERGLSLGDGTVITSVKDYWGVETIHCFDPGVPEHASLPAAPVDGLICTDVLEHIPEEDIPWVLAELFALADGFVYANIAAYPARKTLPNGWNAHVTVRQAHWWRNHIQTAAEGWRGETFEFLIQRRRLMPRTIRRLLRIPKLKSTTIYPSGQSNSRQSGSRR